MYFMFRGRKAAVRNLMIRGETANDQLTGLYNQHQSHSAKTEISSWKWRVGRISITFRALLSIGAGRGNAKVRNGSVRLRQKKQKQQTTIKKQN